MEWRARYECYGQFSVVWDLELMYPVQEYWARLSNLLIGSSGCWCGCCDGLLEISSSGDCLCDVIFEPLRLS
jgi:hypothetical protein